MAEPVPVHPQVVGVGHIALDHHFTVDSAPAAGRKTAARSYSRLVGGMTANALVAAARLGARAELVSPVGDDEAVSDFLSHLQREGVGSAGLHRVPGAQSSVSTVVVDASGERLIVNHRGNALLRAPNRSTAEWQASNRERRKAAGTMLRSDSVAATEASSARPSATASRCTSSRL